MADISADKRFFLPPKWGFVSIIYEDTPKDFTEVEIYSDTFRRRGAAEDLVAWVVKTYPKKDLD